MVGAAQQAIDGGRAHARDHEGGVQLAALEALCGLDHRVVLEVHARRFDAEVCEDGAGDLFGAAARGAEAHAASAQIVGARDGGVAAYDDLQRLFIERRNQPRRAGAGEVVREQRDLHLIALEHRDSRRATGALDRGETRARDVMIPLAREQLAEGQERAAALPRRDADRARSPRRAQHEHRHRHRDGHGCRCRCEQRDAPLRSALGARAHVALPRIVSRRSSLVGRPFREVNAEGPPIAIHACA